MNECPLKACCDARWDCQKLLKLDVAIKEITLENSEYDQKYSGIPLCILQKKKIGKKCFKNKLKIY